MAGRIKPKVEEISLAFNPANKRKFILQKEEGGMVMKKAIAILEKDVLAPQETEFLAFLKEQKVSEDAIEPMMGAFRLLALTKDALPADFTSNLHKSFPLLKDFFDVEAVKKEIHAELSKGMEKDRKKLEKEIRTAVEKEMGMSKDVEIKKLTDTVTALQKETEDTKALLVVEKDARRLAELEKEIKSYGTPGDLVAMAKDVLEAEKLNTDLGTRLLKSYKSLGATFQTTDLFKEVGSSGDGVEGTAHAQLTKIAKEKMTKDAALSETAAFQLAVRENPTLYAEYNKEHFKRVRT